MTDWDRYAEPGPSRLSHLGSVMLAVCSTLPQYVLRSNWDSGRSRLPGSEADMASSFVASRGSVMLGKCPLAFSLGSDLGDKKRR